MNGGRRRVEKDRQRGPLVVRSGQTAGIGERIVAAWVDANLPGLERVLDGRGDSRFSVGRAHGHRSRLGGKRTEQQNQPNGHACDRKDEAAGGTSVDLHDGRGCLRTWPGRQSSRHQNRHNRKPEHRGASHRSWVQAAFGSRIPARRPELSEVTKLTTLSYIGTI